MFPVQAAAFRAHDCPSRVCCWTQVAACLQHKMVPPNLHFQVHPNVCFYTHRFVGTAEANPLCRN